MLAGIKSIPRDQVDASSTQEISDSGSSPRERKDSRSKKKRDDKKRRKKTQDNSSEDDDNTERLKGRSRRRERTKKKASYKSDNDDDIPSQSTSESYSDSEDEKLRKKRYNEKRSNKSSDEDVSSCDGDGVHCHRMRKHVKGKRKEIREGQEDLTHSNKEFMRKEMGLDWMFKPKDTIERMAIEPDDANEEPATDEVKRPNPRQLNPYFKDNGSGFLDNASHIMSSSSALPLQLLVMVVLVGN